ncbi:MAG TPA: hypothetical protein PKE06_05100 [Flavilitoribacter sp.]|nr:hypothetical protein [Flavilitoribacter sp.]HMQ90316.1 hypothetical protein [Flavilitoribacter sp.]
MLKPHDQPFFYRTADGAELDLVVETALKIRFAVEIKLSGKPQLSRGTTVALEDLGNPPLLVVVPEGEPYPLREGVWVCGVDHMAELVEGFSTEYI